MAVEAALSKIREFLGSLRSFEVVCGNGEVSVSEFKGIRKGEGFSKRELKGVRIGRRKIPGEQLQLVLQATERLLTKSVSFKVVFGQNDTMLKFDLDHYVHLYPERCVIVGFSDSSEAPLKYIYDLISEAYDDLRLLAPKG